MYFSRRIFLFKPPVLKPVLNFRRLYAAKRLQNACLTDGKGCSAEQERDMDEVLEAAIRSEPVIVFSKIFCGYSTAVKQILDEVYDGDYAVLELDQEVRGPEIQQALARLTGQRTVPNVFVNGCHVGGYDDTSKMLASGELLKLFKK